MLRILNSLDTTILNLASSRLYTEAKVLELLSLQIVSSMFLEFLEFDGTKHRTARLNSAIALIYQNNSKLRLKKMGQI